jgi:hypothetical protein
LNGSRAVPMGAAYRKYAAALRGVQKYVRLIEGGVFFVK